ncbi:hypothetical protein E4K24_000367 [Enterococcus faecium]|nr:hypothetical protein [Enterococcus faecium]
MKSEYTAKYFRDGMPEWKRKKDPILSRIFYRPVSFLTASWCAKVGISANTVSYFSGVFAIIACLLFLINSYPVKIVAAIMINIWLIMDCTDGNLARSVKSQPFGEFADGISSYILVGIMCITMSYSVYQTGGTFIDSGNAIIILIGAFASSADTMMRLIYQKYKATAAEMVERGIIQPEVDKRTSRSEVGSFRVRIEAELGIGGILPIAILIATIFNALDLIIVYCFMYYGASCVLASLIHVRKAIKHTKEYEAGGK